MADKGFDGVNHFQIEPGLESGPDSLTCGSFDSGLVLGPFLEKSAGNILTAPPLPLVFVCCFSRERSHHSLKTNLLLPSVRSQKIIFPCPPSSLLISGVCRTTR